ncbi:MAG TPA: carboxypeptidase regulatory-like domain-containing protein [Pyrinomonadaceae bacterium]|nr:carboxypeptidase regulatory-like domain-containing protein [Pyrinomonadaceae bacterium]
MSKPFFRAVAAALVLAACGVTASAQMTSVSGKVTLKQADGTEVPVTNATVDIYRTDIKQQFQVKTDKRGAYIHAGLPFIGTYTLAVSAPGARPTFLAGLRFTQTQTQDFALEPGDGTRLTLEQIRQFTASGGAGAAAPASESKEDKAAREERERKIKEIEAKNAEISKSNEVISRTFKAGNEALNAGRYEEAITNYNEGIAARPDEPALLTNLSEALRRRGVDRYNTAIKASDAAAKTQGVEAAKKDWSDAAATSLKAVEAIKANPATDPQQQQIYAQNRLSALSIRAQAMRLVATKVDQAQAQAAWTAYEEYLAAETDPAKKAKFRAEALQMIFDAGNMDLAVAEARKVLAENPDDVDANRIVGLALFASGDKAKYQEAANFLQRYVDKAPDTDPLKVSAKESLTYLKENENVKPASSGPARPARRRP